MQGNQTGRHTFIMLAGVYLLYLSWQLFSGFKNGEAKSPVFILAAVLFAVAGVVIIVTNVKAIIKLSKEAALNTSDEENADTVSETTADATDSPSEADDVEATEVSECSGTDTDTDKADYTG